jgi:hypothetical protein
LLCDPKAGRMSSHIAMQNASAVMSNYEETIQDSKGEAWHSEEIHKRWLHDDFAGRPANAGLVPVALVHGCTQPETVRSETSKPTLSSSPWMRVAPQVGFWQPCGKLIPATLCRFTFCRMPFDDEKSNSSTGGIRRDASVQRSQV